MNAKELDISIQKLTSVDFEHKNIELSIARLDLIDPVISGNKIFKLHYFIEEAKKQNKHTIVTLGGPYSNHLAATASFCKNNDLKAIALVRGDDAVSLSHTLLKCQSDGMKLIFVNRKVYPTINTDNFSEYIKINPAEMYFIPEGGFHPLGASGASIIMDKISESSPTHVIVPIGTATTLAGIVAKSNAGMEVIGISVLKGMTDIESRIRFLLSGKDINIPKIIHDYHFGGYAQKTETLLTFMNDFYIKYQIPTDFVYTGKMMYGVLDMIGNNHFIPGSKIVCLHTGGLQGNLSLPKGSLVF